MPIDEGKLVKEGEKIEDLLHGQMRIIQKEQGYRFSVDPLLLTHFVQFEQEDEIMDLGTGSGVMPLILTARSPIKRMTGIDIQPEMVDMAQRSMKLNKIGNKIEIELWDMRNLGQKFDKESYDLVISNPPYIPVKSGKINPDQEKAIARHEIEITLDELCKCADYLLRPGGSFYLVYPATRTVDLLNTLREKGLEPKTLQFVHSNENSAAKLVLAKALKGGKPEINIVRPLYIYNLEGSYTDEASGILGNGNQEI